MGKHSRQANTREFFTSGERAKIVGSYGTVRRRLGGDSQRRFDQCGLCLQRLSDPVASPAGNLYCRACIVEYLLESKRALAAQRAAWEAEAAKRDADEAAAVAAAREAEAAAFMERETAVATASAVAKDVSGAGGAGAAASSAGGGVPRRASTAASAGLSASDDVSVDAGERARV